VFGALHKWGDAFIHPMVRLMYARKTVGLANPEIIEGETT
jgi:peptide deformylase